MKTLVLGVLMSGAIALPTQAQNLVVPDATLGNEGSIVEPRPGFDAIQGGATRGTGLFHSFSEFGVGDRATVRFLVTPQIQNIFARVTGTGVSNIQGSLGTRIDDAALSASTASLFLLNPNGIVFGPNAKLDLGGSFLATTASSFKFGGSQEFSAVSPQASPLLTVSAPIGLQFGEKVGAIVIDGAKLLPPTDGKSLSLIGGEVGIRNSTLSTISGQLDVGAVGGNEFVGLAPLDVGWQADYGQVRLFRDVTIDRSRLFAGATNTGTFPVFLANLQVQGKRISLSNNSLLQYSYEGVGGSNLRSGKIQLNASELVELNDSNIFATTDGTIPTPGIQITTGMLELSNKSNIVLLQNGGVAGNIDINASQGVLLLAGIKNESQIASFNDSSGDKLGGAINVTAPVLEIYGGSRLATLVAQKGKAGDINLKVDRVIIAGEQRFRSEIYSASERKSIGDTGNINILASSLDLIDGGVINISRFGSGTSGTIDLQVKGAITVSGSTTRGIASTIGHIQELSPLESAISKPGVNIRAGRLLLENGGGVDTSVISDGDALGINIQVDEDVTIRGSVTRSQIFGASGRPIFPASKISSSKFRGIGNGGNIQIRAKTVQLLEGGVIESDIDRDASEASSNIFQGKAGDISIVASDRLLVTGQKAQSLSSRLDIFSSSNISSTVVANAYAQGGKIVIQTGTLQVSSGGQIQSDMLGRGQAGTIEIDATGDATVANVGKDGTSSTISSFASFAAQGNSGSVIIRSNNLNILNGGLVSTATIGRGNAGDITLVLKDDLTIQGQSPEGFLSNVSSSSRTLTPGQIQEQLQQSQALGINFSVPPPEQLGDSGTIRISARNLQIRDRGFISAISNGGGAAGNISINLSDRAILNDAEIRTSSDRTSGGNIDFSARAIVLRNDANIKAGILSGDGSGGNIRLNAGAVVLLDDSDILAFAPEGQGGNITLNTQALLTRIYKPSESSANLLTLDTNGFVDINATGRTAGIVTLPELNPLQNNRPEITPTLIDTDNILSRSCLSRNPKTGKFTITGAGGIPPNPGDPPLSNYSTLPVGSETTIAEADNLYTLANGQVVIGKACQTIGEKS
jgi:filamentous hemagglutinin family protein